MLDTMRGKDERVFHETLYRYSRIEAHPNIASRFNTVISALWGFVTEWPRPRRRTIQEWGSGECQRPLILIPVNLAITLSIICQLNKTCRRIYTRKIEFNTISVIRESIILRVIWEWSSTYRKRSLKEIIRIKIKVCGILNDITFQVPTTIIIFKHCEN